MIATERLDQFVAFSATLTAFTAFELYGTGQAQSYLTTVDDVVGTEIVDDLLGAYGNIADGFAKPGALEKRLRAEILSDPRLGPVARNIIKMWYVGIWYELPRAWADAYGARGKDYSRTVSPAAYTEGLLWPALGANPTGAKARGYGYWAKPPSLPGFNNTPA